MTTHLEYYLSPDSNRQIGAPPGPGLVLRRLGANEQKVDVRLKFVGQGEGMVNNKTTGPADAYICLRRRGVAIQEAPYQVMHGTRLESNPGGQASDETVPSSPPVACVIVTKIWMRAGGAKEEGGRMVPR